MLGCCTDEEVATYFNEPGLVSFSSMEDCVAAYQGLTEALALPAPRMSIERGYVEYDAEAAGACLDDVAVSSCADLDFVAGGERGGDCLGAFVPRQRAGEPCFGGSDCTDGPCVYADEEEGTCTPLPQAGEPCTFTCAEPLRCGLDSNLEYRCPPRLQLGEACSDGDDCESLQCLGDLGSETCQDERACQGA